MPKIGTRDRLAIAAVGLLGALAFVQHWLGERRPEAADQRVSHEIAVTTSEDRGEGSLREAIFAADTAGVRTRIVLRTPRIALRSPLPPLVNRHGIVVQGDAGGTEIEVGFAGSGAALEVRGDHTQVAGVSFTAAASQAILVA